MKALPQDTADLLIVGGGINGVGIARDAVGRGLSVVLCEQGDLAGATSWTSSKLLHGGLRYLEQYEFRQVRHALAEREVLMAAAPHLVTPLRFVLPHNGRLRPVWMIRIGLLLYDNLARRQTLPGSTSIDFREDPAGEPLRPELTRGFTYADCWVDDARLVILNALDARERGATIMPRTKLIAAERGRTEWLATVEDQISRERHEIRAKLVINAAGPWAESVARDVLGIEPRLRSRLVKGSHIVVPRLYEGEQAYILQSDDRRVVFVLPFQDDYTLIGTTDVPYDGDPSSPAIDADETHYLCDVVNGYFSRRIGPDDVHWTYSGVRPLYDDGSGSESDITRDYVLEPSPSKGQPVAAPALTIWGGKLTGYRTLAEDALDRIRPFFPKIAGRWTADAVLPGGDLHPAPLNEFVEMLTRIYPWLPEPLARDYARRYGTRVHRVMGNASSLEQLGEEISPGLFEREARYLLREEWAHTAEDILWRRTKLGLRATDASIRKLAKWLKSS